MKNKVDCFDIQSQVLKYSGVKSHYCDSNNFNFVYPEVTYEGLFTKQSLHPFAPFPLCTSLEKVK